MGESGREPLDDVGVSVAPEGTEEGAFTDSWEAVSEAGADVDVLGVETGEAKTVNDDLEGSESYAVDRTFAAVSADEYDALVVPGGTVGADELRVDEDAVSLLREHVADGKPVGVIRHGPLTLVEEFAGA